jgi:AcrR family transcriptional regulator
MSPPQARSVASVAPKRRRNAAATKEAILQAALKAFSASGYDGAGLREIAQAVGVDPRLVGYYFESKEKLFEAVVGYSMDSPLLVPTATPDAATRLLTRSQAPAVSTSTTTPSCMSLYIDAVPANETFEDSSVVPSMASATVSLIAATCLIPSSEVGSPWWVMMNRIALPSPCLVTPRRG